MAYYHDILTTKSWDELIRIKNKLDFVLIGGWAVYLYTRSLKSKDIDILVNYNDLEKLRELYPNVYKNDRLSKYEAVLGDVQVDVYLPHFSKIGIPVEKLIEETRLLDGFNVLDANYLTVLKIFTYGERKGSSKGRKDFLDLVSLIKSGAVDFLRVSEICNTNSFDNQFNQFVNDFIYASEVKELDLNPYAFSRLKQTVKI